MRGGQEPGVTRAPGRHTSPGRHRLAARPPRAPCFRSRPAAPLAYSVARRSMPASLRACYAQRRSSAFAAHPFIRRLWQCPARVANCGLHPRAAKVLRKLLLDAPEAALQGAAQS